MKAHLREIGCGLDLSCLGYSQMAGCFEQGNKPWVSTKQELLEHFSNYEVFNENP
jgi:hypothetical protein